VANEVIGIDIVARLDQFRAELGKIPDIGAKDARQLVTALSREIKGAERASKAAADASRVAARATRAHGAAAATATGPIRGMTASMAKAAIGTELLFRGMRLLGRGLRAAVDEAVRLDTAAGGDLAPTLATMREQAHGLWVDAVQPMIPGIRDLAEAFGGLLAGMRESGYLETWAQGLSDVAQGAALATRALFGLDAEQRRQQAASEEGQRRIREQSDQIEVLRRELEDWSNLESNNSTALAAQAGEVARLTAAVEREVGVLRRLKGELADLPNIGIGAPSPRRGPAAAPGAEATGDGGAATQEAAVARLARAWASLSEATSKAQMAELDGAARIEAQRDVDVAALAARRDAVLALIEGDLAKQEEAEAIFAAGRLSIERDASAEIVALRQSEAEQLAEVQRSVAEEQARIHEETMAAIEEEQAARRAAARDWLSVTASAGDAIGSVVQAVSDISIAATEEETEARLEAQRAAWWAQAISAIATAAINIPLSISQASAAGYPQAIGFMIAAGVASTAALAGVIAKTAAGPGFHSGGLAPDEAMARVLPGEAVIPESSVRRYGEERTREIVRGEDSGGQVVVVSRVGHRTTEVTTHQALRRRRGALYDAVRGTQPRSGLHSPWSS